MMAETRCLSGLLCLLLLGHLNFISGRVLNENGLYLQGSQLGSDEEPFEGNPFHESRYQEPQRNTPLLEQTEERPSRDCSSSSDCYSDECCHIGMQRFSFPTCQRLGDEGDFCRVNQETVNTTLSYPNGLQIVVTEGHVLFCPCTVGLTCLRATCRPNREVFLQEHTPVNNL